MRASVFLFLFLLPTVSATSLLFDSYVTSGTNFTVDWHSFIVRWTNKGIYVKSDLKDFFLTEYPCQKIFPYIVCLNSTLSTAPQQPLRITVAKEKPLLDIQRIYSTNEAETGTYITVDVTLTNQGLDDIHMIDYRDTYPESIRIIGRTLAGNTYQQTVEMLKPYASIRFRYTLLVRDVGTYRSTAQASYTVKGRPENAYSPYLLLKVDPRHIIEPFKIITTTEKNPLELDRETVLSIVIQNDQENELQLPYVDVQVPEQFAVRERDFHKQGVKYVAQGSVQGHHAKQFSIGLTPAKEGSYEITITAGGNVMGTLQEKHISVFLNPTIAPLQKEPVIQYNISDNVLGMIVKVTNTNTYTTFDDVHIKLSSPVFQFNDAVFNKIRPGETVEAFVQKLEIDKALRNPLLRYTAEYKVNTVFYKDDDFIYLGQPKEDVYQETGKELQLSEPNVPPEVEVTANVQHAEPGQEKNEETIKEAARPLLTPTGNVVVAGTYVDHSPLGSIRAFFERVVKVILS